MEWVLADVKSWDMEPGRTDVSENCRLRTHYGKSKKFNMKKRMTMMKRRRKRWK
jgi:hypothetical protein